MLGTLKRTLAHPRLPVLAAMLGLALTLPALGAGFFADDFTHQISFRPEFRALGGIHGDWDMFRFQDADRAYLRRIMDIGIWPWWTAPSLRIAFFRPLSSLSHAFDYRVLPGWPVIMHAENLALYAAIVLVAALLYRRLLAPAWVAGLAAVLYAVDDAHSLPATWIAMRNASISTLFGFAAILAYDRARGNRSARAAVIAPVLYALGLLGGEAAIATLAYLAAHALYLDEAPPRERAAALVPYAGVTLGWALIYKALGYGTFGSGMYVDPGVQPLAFARAVAERLPVLLSAQLFGPPADIAMGLSDPGFRALMAFSVLAISTIGLGMARLLAGDRRAAFFAAGMALSLVPACGTMPNDRLLLFCGLGAFGLVAQFVARVSEGVARRYERALAVVLVVVHAVIAPIALPLRSMGIAWLYGSCIARADHSLPQVGPTGTLILLNATDLLIPNYAESARVLRGLPPPRSTRLLATAIDGNEGWIARVDDRTLDITLQRGFAGDPLSQLPRGPSVPYATGDVAEVEGMTAEVRELTSSGLPRTVRFTFDRPLEDPSLHWVIWRGRAFEPASPPPVGAVEALPSIDFTAAVVGR